MRAFAFLAVVASLVLVGCASAPQEERAPFPDSVVVFVTRVKPARLVVKPDSPGFFVSVVFGEGPPLVPAKGATTTPVLWAPSLFVRPSEWSHQSSDVAPPPSLDLDLSGTPHEVVRIRDGYFVAERCSPLEGGKIRVELKAYFVRDDHVWRRLDKTLVVDEPVDETPQIQLPLERVDQRSATLDLG